MGFTTLKQKPMEDSKITIEIIEVEDSEGTCDESTPAIQVS